MKMKNASVLHAAILVRTWFCKLFTRPLIGFRHDIRFYLIRIGQAVGAVKHVDHRNQFGHSFIVQSEPLHGGTVGVNSVGAVVGDGNRQGDDFLGQQVELAGLHHGF